MSLKKTSDGITRRSFIAFTTAGPALLTAADPRPLNGAVLRLFGRTLTWRNGKWDGLFGSLNISPPTASPLLITLDERFPLGSCRVKARFSFTIVDGAVHLGASADRGQIEFTRWSKNEAKIHLEEQTFDLVAGDQFIDEGFGFQLDHFDLNDAASFITELFADSYPDEFSGGLPVVLTLHAREKDAISRLGVKPRPGARPHLFTVVDSYRTSAGLPGGRQLKQRLMFRDLTWSDTDAVVHLDPEEDALLIHPDILDPTAPATGWNNLLYQFALANGTLEGKTRIGRKDNTVWWVGTEGAPAALLAYRFHDENGHPLVLEAPAFPLAKRTGTNRQVMANTQVTGEHTSAGVVLGSPANDGHWTGNCELRSIDPRRVTQKVAEQRAWPPYWLAGPPGSRRIALRTAPPREIHGINRGAYLKRAQNRSAAAKCDVVTQPTKRHSDILFMTAEWQLDAADWILLTYFEGHDYYSGSTPTPRAKQPALRTATPGNGGKLTFPLIDTSYALANLLAGRQEGIIAKSAAAWLTRLNRDLTTPGRFSFEKSDQTTHATGYEYDPVMLAFDTLVDPAPARACRRDTLPRGVRIKAAKPQYLHGGVRDGDAIHHIITENLDSPPARDFARGLVTFKTFWNGRGLQREGLFAREVLRAYLNPEVESGLSPSFIMWLRKDLDVIIDELELVFGKGTFKKMRSALHQAGPTDDEFKEAWSDTKNAGDLAWQAFRAAARQYYVMAKRAESGEPEFFVRAAARAADIVYNFSGDDFESFPDLQDAVPRQIDRRWLGENWVKGPAGVTPVTWKLFREYVEDPATPGLYRRSLQALFGTPATKIGVKNVAEPVFDSPAVVQIGNVTITVSGESLRALADAINKAIATDPRLSAFKESVRAFTQQLADDRHHLLIDSKGAVLVSITINGDSKLDAAVYDLQGAYDELTEKVNRFATDFNHYFEDQVPGFLTKAREGVDERMAQLEKLWRDGTGELLDKVRSQYGPLLTPDVYRHFLAAADEEAREGLRKLFNDEPGTKIRNLADLPSEPPSYLFVTKCFPVVNPVDEADLLWRRSFELCKFGKKSWRFFLDRDSAVVVKLDRTKTLPDILEEIHAQYYDAATRANPLGLRAPHIEGVREFISGLHEDLKQREWAGVVVIQPTADISADQQLADVCGFEQITADYAAIGGAKLDDADLDVYARIRREASPRNSDKDTDVALTLVKFDASIKHTSIEAGEILLILHPKNVWGKLGDFSPINIRGTLAKEPNPGAEEASSFEFAAVFEKPARLDVKLAFVDYLELRAIRVARSRGQTSLNIDGELRTKDCDIGSLKVMGPGSFGLQNFKILLPSAGGKATGIGFPRMLDFEFPSVTFDIRKPKSFQLNFLDLKLTGIGLLRDNDSRNRLKDRYDWVTKPGDWKLGKYFSFLRFEVDFGRLPLLGVGDVGDLKMEVALGAFIEGGVKETHAGIGSFDAKDIHVDLFRLLTLEIEELFLENGWTVGGESATVIGANKARLKLLDWPVFGEKGALSLRLFHGETGNRATIASLYKKKDELEKETSKKPFFQIHWVVLANGLLIPDDVLTQLISPEPKLPGVVTPADKVIENIENREKKSVTAGFLPSSSWLFGASFEIGDIITPGSFVLHDQHYYGISLSAKWLKELIGSERLTLAYIPGARPELDRFRTSFRLEKLNFIAGMRSGEVALEWGPNWDFLVDVGFPWKSSAGYQWERTFSIPLGTYEARFGVFIQKTTAVAEQTGEDLIVLSAGIGFYYGYRYAADVVVAWVRAGIGVFVIFQGTIRFRRNGGIPGSIVDMEVTGVIGIYAYGEGGIDVWILSSRFAVSVQAAIAGTLRYIVGGGSCLTYAATLNANYAASTRVGCGPFSWTFSVSGQIGIGVSGRLALT